MRPQLKTATTGTSTPPSVTTASRRWCKPAWHRRANGPASLAPNPPRPGPRRM